MAWWANRPTPPIPKQEIEYRFQRSVDWLTANKQIIMADGNAALWWMLKIAGRTTHDQRLNELVSYFEQHLPAQPGQETPWHRLLDPSLPPQSQASLPPGLEGYQRFFFHALTCQDQALQDGQSSNVYLTQNMCRPMLAKVWASDRVCSTHQLMGLELHRQMNCAGATHANRDLQQELVDDIQTQLKLSPIFEDAYLQRVLILTWLDPRQDESRQIWLKRTLMAQGIDGGWAGRYQMPEWPTWAQLSAFRHLGKTLLGRPSNLQPDSDFHATAQGVLLLALMLKN